MDDRSVTNLGDDHVEVRFRTETDEDGRPPTSAGSLWAVDLGDGTARSDSTPRFVRRGSTASMRRLYRP